MYVGLDTVASLSAVLGIYDINSLDHFFKTEISQFLCAICTYKQTGYHEIFRKTITIFSCYFHSKEHTSGRFLEGTTPCFKYRYWFSDLLGKKSSLLKCFEHILSWSFKLVNPHLFSQVFCNTEFLGNLWNPLDAWVTQPKTTHFRMIGGILLFRI